MSMPASFCRFTTSATARSSSPRHLPRIDRLARLALDQQLGDRLVARQAADMRGQDAVAAGDHGLPRRLRCADALAYPVTPAASAARPTLPTHDARKNARSFSRAARPCAEIEAVHDREPEAARRHRVLARRLVLVEGDLHARHGRHRAHLIDERLRRMAIARPVRAEQHHAVAVAAVRCRDSPSDCADRAAPAPRPSPGRKDPATGRRSADAPR